MSPACCATCTVENCILRCQGLRVVALPCDPSKCLPAMRLKCESYKGVV